MFFLTGNAYGFIQMERKNGTAADGGVKYCIWYAGNEVGIISKDGG